MAHRQRLISGLVIAVAMHFFTSSTSLADNRDISVTLTTIAHGAQQWDYLQATGTDQSGTHTAPIPTRPGPYCYYSQWRLFKVHPVGREREYGIYIYDSCTNNHQVFPTNALQCMNDDGSHPLGAPSTCVTLEPGHLPVGLPLCNIGSEISTALLAALDPPTYDASKPTTLTATTSFATDFAQRLSEGTCTDVLDWQVIGWTLKWSDQTVDILPGSGQSGITATHHLAPAPGLVGTTESDITAIAHLHIHGQVLDFDQDGNIVTVDRDAYVDISNHASNDGEGNAPTYTPPQLSTGAIGIGQRGDGTIPTLDSSMPANAHLDTIRGRLLTIYPRAVVIAPGTESIDGVAIGQASTTTTTWTYLGDRTDAPTRETTANGQSGSTTDAVAVQWNHAERLAPNGQPIDEIVPLTITAHTVYPDGTSRDDTITGNVAVSIYYTGLNFMG